MLEFMVDKICYISAHFTFADCNALTSVRYHIQTTNVSLRAYTLLKLLHNTCILSATF